jgi:hypothetical protein
MFGGEVCSIRHSYVNGGHARCSIYGRRGDITSSGYRLGQMGKKLVGLGIGYYVTKSYVVGKINQIKATTKAWHAKVSQKPNN